MSASSSRSCNSQSCWRGSRIDVSVSECTSESSGSDETEFPSEWRDSESIGWPSDSEQYGVVHDAIQLSRGVSSPETVRCEMNG